MLERIVALCEPLAATVGVLHNSVTLPMEEEWIVVKEVCKILKPFELITIELSVEKQMTLSKLILIVKGLISSLKRIKVHIKSKVSHDLIKSLLSLIYTRFGNPENNIVMGKSSFLDPRFKTKGFSNEDRLKRVKDKLQEEIIGLIKKRQEQNSIPETKNDSTTNIECESDDIIWQDFDNFVKSSVNKPNSNCHCRIKNVFRRFQFRA